MKFFVQSSLTIGLLIFSLSGFVAGAASSKDTLSVATSSEFDTLNPLIATQAATKYMLYLAYRPLVILDLDSKWSALMIKKLPSLENKLAKIKGEGLEVNIEIIDSATWGDGVPVTCKDIEFAWTLGKSNNVSNGNREPYENISSVVWDAKSPKKCVLTLKKKKFDFFASLPDPMPAHIEGPVFEKFGGTPEGYDRNSLYVKEPTNPGLWFGPYVVSEVKLGSHVIFVENPKWTGKKPGIKKFIFKLLPNNGTHIANLKSGNVDLLPPGASISLDQSVAFEKEVKDQKLAYVIHYQDGQVYAHMDLNLDNAILKDLKVRKALSLGFDKNEALNSLLAGHAKPALHFLTDKDPWYTDKVPVYKYNQREAAKLLDEAGWKMGPNGIRQKDGKNLELTLYGGAGNKLVELIEAYLQDQYKKIGIQLFIKNEPGRVFFGETTPHRKFDMAFYSWVSVPENSPRSMLHSGKIPAAENSWAGQNHPGWKNAEVDKLIDLLEGELNAKKRAEHGKKIAKIYAEEIPVIPFYFRQNNSVVPKDLKNYRLSGHLFYETLYAESWTF